MKHVHTLAALFALLSIILPIIGMTFAKLNKQQLISRARKTFTFVRIQNLFLIISLITGVLQWGRFEFNWWIITVFILFLAIAATLGITMKSLRVLISQAESNQPYQPSISKFITMSTVATVVAFAMLALKLMY
ncbi:hypothetical protein [Brevibacillus dissolubilis]|uniref:hypothetical protein n=1 Tax=Brevibacillus dissolubilis TaxID=1844116 RepID=UPI0011177354|nr:hypothetical protein [Brevibacillus dissolubilis]